MTDGLTGEFIRAGTNRQVWQYQLDPDCVIKTEHSGVRANRDEHRTRRILRLFGADQFLAPCRYLPGHQAIVMPRGSDFQSGWYEIPSVVPWQNSDNFRMFNGCLRLIDYDWRILRQGRRLFWYMPVWDWHSVSDCEAQLGPAEPAEFAEFALPGEQYHAPEDRQTEQTQFVRVGFAADAVRACFEQTRTVWLDRPR